MANQAGGTRMDTVVKLVLIFFISLLSFSVGTYVGKGFSDSEYLESALDRGDYQGFRKTASTGGEKSQDAISEDEIQSLTEEFVNVEKTEMAAKAQDPHATQASTEDQHQAVDTGKEGYKKFNQKGGDKKFAQAKPSAEYQAKIDEKTKKVEDYKKLLAEKNASNEIRDVASAAKNVAEGKAPAKDEKPKRGPDSVLPTLATSSVGKYTVQVASYATEAEAQNHAERLKTKGFSAFYIPADVKGKTWYRVSVGLFADSKSALAYRQELMKDGHVDSAIVQKIVQ